MTVRVRDVKPIYRCRVCGQLTEEETHCGKPCLLVLDPEKRVRLSKLLSGLLRHFPHTLGVKLDEEGFTKQTIEELADLIRTRWRSKHLYRWLKPEHIYAVVILDPKGRFEIKEGRIRARYGHSIRVSVKYEEEVEPPAKLYHGTTPQALPSILREGLKPGRRLMVHLTATPKDAWETALRKTLTPVIIEVDVGVLAKRGIKVYRAGKTVYVTRYVPPEAIKVLDIKSLNIH
ncbi:MAG: RNA 2'-phosphotransferase [Thermoprotei archaeon]|nr:MAG: RNA 2'-phosphotransferase [Thermoprotei archaeon]HDD33748.1 RNA 2'-phosphotransferase [Thermofilaceae archaeon]